MSGRERLHERRRSVLLDGIGGGVCSGGACIGGACSGGVKGGGQSRIGECLGSACREAGSEAGGEGNVG